MDRYVLCICSSDVEMHDAEYTVNDILYILYPGTSATHRESQPHRKAKLIKAGVTDGENASAQSFRKTFGSEHHIDSTAEPGIGIIGVMTARGDRPSSHGAVDQSGARCSRKGMISQSLQNVAEANQLIDRHVEPFTHRFICLTYRNSSRKV